MDNKMRDLHPGTGPTTATTFGRSDYLKSPTVSQFYYKATARARRLAELRNDLLVFRAQQARLDQSREAAYNDSVMDEGNEAPKNPFVVVHWT